MMRPAEPGKQCGQFRPVQLTQCREFQSQTNAGFGMPHDRVGSNLPFLHEKMQSGQNALSLWFRSLDEQASHAHVQNQGNILAPVAVPVHPDIPGCRNARG
jgi:hypothetical protein